MLNIIVFVVGALFAIVLILYVSHSTGTLKLSLGYYNDYSYHELLEIQRLANSRMKRFLFSNTVTKNILPLTPTVNTYKTDWENNTLTLYTIDGKTNTISLSSPDVIRQALELFYP